MSDNSKYTPIGDWVDWMGGLCPIKREILVEVKLRGTTTAVGKAGIWWWGVEGGIGSIIAYRLVEEAKPVREQKLSSGLKELGKRLAALLNEEDWKYIEPFLRECEASCFFTGIEAQNEHD